VVTVTVTHDDDHALFSVRDTGRGIPTDRLEGIFERFRQVDASDAREKGGTGLGLPIARGIVEQHGGHIWAESLQGEGSTLRFTLPLASETHKQDTPPSEPFHVESEVIPRVQTPLDAEVLASLGSVVQ
jgi:signal transduction histidine kinase